MRYYLTHFKIIAASILITIPLHTIHAKEPTELVFLTWPEYIDPEVVTEFEQSRNAKIRFVYFQGDDSRDRMLLDTNGRGFDLVLVSGMPIHTYVRRGWFEPINEKHIPNVKHVSNKWRSTFKDAKQFAVPYAWGTVGIAYRADLIPTPPTSWKQFFTPPANIGKSIVMIDSGREVIGMALKALGYSINTKDVNEIRQAEKLLLQQKSFVKDYAYINITEQSSLVSGNTKMAIAYNGDALVISEYHPQIKFVIPEEGTLLWVDYLAVMSASENKKLAFDFINYLNEPSNAAKLALYTSYATPNIAAEKQLPEDFLNNPAIYPSEATLETSEAEKPLNPRSAKEYGRIMATLTR